MKKYQIRLIVVLLAMATTVILAMVAPRPQADDQLGVVMRVPENSIAGLYAPSNEPVQRYMSAEERRWLPVDTEVVRQAYRPLSDFSRSSTGLNFVRIGVVLAGADSRSLHRPEVCLPGQGWTIGQAKVRSVKISDEQTVEVKVLPLTQNISVEGQEIPIHAEYWYWWEGPTMATPNTYLRTLYQMKEAMFSSKVTRWAYPSVFGQIDIDPTRPLEERRKLAEASMEAVLREWAAQMLVRCGAKPLDARELQRAELESIEPEASK